MSHDDDEQPELSDDIVCVDRGFERPDFVPTFTVRFDALAQFLIERERLRDNWLPALLKLRADIAALHQAATLALRDSQPPNPETSEARLAQLLRDTRPGATRCAAAVACALSRHAFY